MKKWKLVSNTREMEFMADEETAKNLYYSMMYNSTLYEYKNDTWVDCFEL